MNNFNQLPLRDIHLPDPISWWPPAVGWWLVLVLFISVVFLIWWGTKKVLVRRQHRNLHRWVQQELDRMEAEYGTTANANKLLQDLSILVRRIAMSNFPRRDVAGLCGTKWERWLRDPGVGKGLNEQSIQLLVDGPYKKDIAVDVIELLRTCRQWIMSVMRHPQRVG